MLTFQDYYEQEIQPQIAAIDIFLKSEEPPYHSETVRILLGITPVRWAEILQEEKISFLTRGIFFQLMKRGDSPLCKMFRRAMELYLPEAYTSEVIAYVFDLPISSVRAAVKATGQRSFTEPMLSQVFSKIRLAETQYRLSDVPRKMH